VFGQGADYAPTAQGTASKALGTLDPAVAYWNAILKGGPEATAAVAPYATQVGTNYANAGAVARSGLPAGGYSATIQAGLPFAQAHDVNDALLKLQPEAAKNLNTIAGTQSTIGSLQGNLAQILFNAGIGQEGQGSNLLQAVLQAILGKNQVNVQESGQNKGLAGSLANSAVNFYGTNVNAGR